MLKELVLSLTFIKEVTPEGKEVKKQRRFNQVRMDMNDQEINDFKMMISTLTGETYVFADKIETKIVA